MPPVNRKAALLIAAIVVVVGGATALAWLRPTLRTAERGRRERERAERAAAHVSPQWRADVDAVLADTALWAVLLPQGPARDAAPYLADRVSWDRAPAAHPPKMPAATADALARDNLFMHADEVPLTGLDTSWMRPLPRYTVWDLDASPPRTAAPDDSLLLAARPEVLPLLRWGRARLVQGLVRGDVQAASDEVRALARLLWSTDRALDDAVAARLIADDAAARAAGRRLGDALTSPEIATAAKLQKVTESEGLLFQVYTPASLTHFEQTDVVFCGALADGAAAFLLGGRSFARHAGRRASIGRALAQSPCRLTRIRRQWATGGGALPTTDARSLVSSWLEDAIIAVVAMPPRGYFADALEASP